MCADYQTVACELQFDDTVPPVSANLGVRPPVKIGRNHALLQHGFYRNPANDEKLLSKFGLSWWANVGPYLDGDLHLQRSQHFLDQNLVADNAR
jgi:hypothetical protein